jgi:cell division control protein 6
MEPSAVQFCARKISAVAGDMRKALDVCHRAVELVEHEVKAQQVISSPTKRPPAVPKKIGIVQINKVLSEVYGSSSTYNGQESIPLQQKLILCTLLLMVKQGKFKEVTMGKVSNSRKLTSTDFRLFIVPKHLNYLAFQSFDFECTWGHHGRDRMII